MCLLPLIKQRVPALFIKGFVSRIEMDGRGACSMNSFFFFFYDTLPQTVVNDRYDKCFRMYV